jgi:hypothetical protein
MADSGAYEGWVILELMGHRRLIGYLAEEEIAGRPFLRIDVLSDPPATQFYSTESVYCITPTTEETARRASALSRVAPIQQWELPPAKPQDAPADDGFGDGAVWDGP